MQVEELGMGLQSKILPKLASANSDEIDIRNARGYTLDLMCCLIYHKFGEVAAARAVRGYHSESAVRLTPAGHIMHQA